MSVFWLVTTKSPNPARWKNLALRCFKWVADDLANGIELCCR